MRTADGAKRDSTPPDEADAGRGAELAPSRVRGLMRASTLVGASRGTQVRAQMGSDQPEHPGPVGSGLQLV